MPSHRFNVASIVALCTALSLPGAAAATLAAPVATAMHGSLQEIVVTATRSEQPRLDVPLSISRLDGDELARVGAQHAYESLNRVAGVLIQRGSGQESLIAVRSPVLTGSGACGAFLILEDEMPVRPTGFCNVNELFEINTEQAGALEVIRGPAPVTYGANGLHGVVNVRSPSAAALQGLRIALESGAADWRRASFAVGNAHPGRSFGAYGIVSRDGGFRADSRVADAKLNLLYERRLGGGELRWRMATTLLDQETAGFVRGFNAYRDPQISRSNPNPEAFRDAWSARMSTAWNKQACPGCSDDLRFALRRSSMSFLQHFLLGKPLERNGQSSALLAASRARSWRAGSTNGKWRTGIEAEWASTELVERQDLPTIEGSAEARAIRPVGRHYDYSVRSRTLAGYGSGAWSPQAAWTLSLGARLESTSYAYDNRMRDGNAAESGQACAFGGCLFSRPADRSDTFRNFAPRFDGTFRASSNDRIFVSVAAGFRPPETSELYRLQRQQNIARLASERVRSIELGWRHEDARLATSLAAFAMRKSAVILRESNGFNVDNGRTRHEGIEYELRWRAFPDLTVSSSGALARHRYDFSRGIDGGEQVIAGRDVDTAPRQQHRLAVDWRPTPSLQAEVEIAVLGPYFLDAANERTYPGHAVANLRASWRLSSAWKATLRLRNLADRRYADRADFAQGDYRYFPAAGRSLYVALEYGRNSGSGTAALDATPPRPDNPVSFSDPRTGE